MSDYPFPFIRGAVEAAQRFEEQMAAVQAASECIVCQAGMHLDCPAVALCRMAWSELECCCGREVEA